MGDAEERIPLDDGSVVLLSGEVLAELMCARPSVESASNMFQNEQLVQRKSTIDNAQSQADFVRHVSALAADARDDL